MSHNTAPVSNPNIINRVLDKFPGTQSVIALGATTVSLMTMGCGPTTEAKPTPPPTQTIATQSGESPFVAMPFAKKDGQNFFISQGETIAPDDARVVGADSDHSAIDIEGVPCGTDILAPFDGVAVADYQLWKVRGGKPFDPTNPTDPETNYQNPKTGQEGPVFGTGLFTEVIAATKNDKNEITGGVTSPSGEGYMSALIVHMGSAANNIVKLKTIPKGTVTNGNETIQLWHPEGIVVPQAELIKVGTPVKKGDKLGTVGNSAIGLRGDDFSPVTFTVDLHNTPGDMPWDPPTAEPGANNLCQTHMSIGGPRDAELKRPEPVDILDNPAQIIGIQGEEGYVNPLSQPGKVFVGPKTVLIVDENGHPKFADER